MSGSAILDDLDARGLLHDHTDRQAFADLLDSGPVTFYYGVDPTADSLHAGNLIGLLVLRRFQEAGHRPIALAGGATGMIGDPSGRSDERNLLDAPTLAANVAGIKAQLSRFVDFGHANVPAVMVDNADWTVPTTLVDFLRNVGKHFTINQMVAKESVRSRMSSEAGISFTEFSYMLLQANDFAHLHRVHGCLFQIGGSDQWGNITAGIDLIRRRFATTAHGLTWPLLTRADGSKFGKSMGDNIWLAPERTSPYRFFQYWINTDDRDLRRFLLQLTLLPVGEVDDILVAHEAAPERRLAQQRLAVEVTSIVHGEAAAESAQEASAVLFGRASRDIPSPGVLATLDGEIPTARMSGPVTDPLEALIAVGLATSKGDARRAIAGNGVEIAGQRLAPDQVIDPDSVWHGQYVLIRRGKQYGLLVLDGA